MDDLTLAVDAIARSGLARIDDFLSPLHIDALAARARARLAAGDFRPASIGRGPRSLQREDIRGDRIAWWPDEQQTPEEDDARTAFENLRQTLNATLRLGLFEHELHYAHYRPVHVMPGIATVSRAMSTIAARAWCRPFSISMAIGAPTMVAPYVSVSTMMARNNAMCCRKVAPWYCL